MQREPEAYLWDARQAIDSIVAFTRDRSWDDFQQDLMLRSGVERQLEIVGESLNQLSRRDAALAAQIPDLRQIVAFRNVLIHGYTIVDAAQVWQVATEDLPELRKTIERLMDQSDQGDVR